MGAQAGSPGQCAQAQLGALGLREVRTILELPPGLPGRVGRGRGGGQQRVDHVVAQVQAPERIVGGRVVAAPVRDERADALLYEHRPAE